MEDEGSDRFPWDVLHYADFPGEDGELVGQVRRISMFPPHPWGHWLYGTLLREHCARLPGDLVEAGVGLGGMSVYLAALVNRLGLDKKVVAVDSFTGLPPPREDRDNPYFVSGDYSSSGEGGENLLQWLRVTAANFKVTETVVPVPGLFEDVLPELEPGRQFCLVHIDADLYDSVLCSLDNLYDRVVDGGVVVIDDFFHPSQGPARAAAEFFNLRGLAPVYHVAFPYGVFVFKEPWQPSKPRVLDGNAYSFEWLRRDGVLLQALDESLKRSRGHARANDGCALLLDVLRRPEDRYADIYDYWRALEEFWESIGIGPRGAEAAVEVSDMTERLFRSLLEQAKSQPPDPQG